ncbi:SagB/ThcOx family dehydrogenase [Virgibacillus siamensis]|uniref:SagB/ThcOx family dehydrogenase n=1 Tax=Virgibacillus siamensis TaxID=480071 RepID=UPI00158961AB|nr:SagB/ThcOx family dehydrogenase [Virgibacillus siamensis]
MKLFESYHKESSWPPVFHPNPSKKDEELNPGDKIDLDSHHLEQMLSNCIMSRKTSKSIGVDSMLNKDDLGTFLKWSVGNLKADSEQRAYPSAGPIYPNHIFVTVKQIANLEKGLYTYIPKDHALLWVGGNIEIENALVQPDIDFNFCLIVSADLDYAAYQYGERGYRFCLLEAGHMVQNMMLVASALEKAIAPIGGFKDEYINQHVLKNGHSALYLVPVGRASDLQL